MTRDQALTHIRIAGYHDDGKAYIRIYTENRVSLTAAREAFERGAKQRVAGWPCSCQECAKRTSNTLKPK